VEVERFKTDKSIMTNMPTIAAPKRFDYHLAKKGFRLVGGDPPAGFRAMPTEDLIVRVLKYATQARHVEGLPIAIYKSPPDYERLQKLAVRYGVQNQVGYVLDMTKRLFEEKGVPTTDLERTIAVLHKEALHAAQFLYPMEKDIASYFSAIRKTVSPEERKWNIKLGMAYDEFYGQFKVHIR